MIYRTRRDFIKNTAAIVGAPFLKQIPKALHRPNILLIMCDQLSGGVLQDRSTRKYLNIPNLDRLANRSLRFTRAYAATPLCVPARTAIFTGTYPIQNSVETNSPHPLSARRFPCLGSFVREAGYQTAYFGKWHLPYAETDTNTHGFEVMATSDKPKDTETASLASRFLADKHHQPFFCVASLLEPHNICEWARGQALDQGENLRHWLTPDWTCSPPSADSRTPGCRSIWKDNP